MAHKTLINGTGYQIKTGKTLVNGTAYKVKNGKTLVNGTIYQIGWASHYYISGYGSLPSGNTSDLGMDDTCAYATINGAKYTSDFSNIQIAAGTTISLKVSASHSDRAFQCWVKLNGTLVQDGGGTYSFTPTNNCTIRFIYNSEFVNWTYVKYWQAEITM